MDDVNVAFLPPSFSKHARIVDHHDHQVAKGGRANEHIQPTRNSVGPKHLFEKYRSGNLF